MWQVEERRAPKFRRCCAVYPLDLRSSFSACSIYHTSVSHKLRVARLLQLEPLRESLGASNRSRGSVSFVSVARLDL